LITFDLDGVIRFLAYEVFGREPNDWHERLDGKSLVEIVNGNLKLLQDAPPTQYYEVIKELFPNPHIMSFQAESWRNHTLWWLNKYFNNYTIDFVNHGTDKVTALKTKLIVEDYPEFPKEFYKRVILVRHKYNENVKDEDCYAVVDSAEGLKGVLWTLKKQKY